MIMSATKQKQPLGKIELKFDEQGKYKTAYLINCNLEPQPYNEILNGLLRNGSGSNDADLCEAAKEIFSNLFTMVNRVELADRELYKVNARPEMVTRNDAGIITDILISFSLDEI